MPIKRELPAKAQETARGARGVRRSRRDPAALRVAPIHRDVLRLAGAPLDDDELGVWADEVLALDAEALTTRYAARAKAVLATARAVRRARGE